MELLQQQLASWGVFEKSHINRLWCKRLPKQIPYQEEMQAAGVTPTSGNDAQVVSIPLGQPPSLHHLRQWQRPVIIAWDLDVN